MKIKTDYYATYKAIKEQLYSKWINGCMAKEQFTNQWSTGRG